MLQRLLGLETEYAVGVSPRRGDGPTNADVYAAVREAVEAQVLARPGEASLQQIFLINGGSLSYESLPWARDDGLVEGATAECGSPGAALLHQRAQDALLARAAQQAARRLSQPGRPVEVSLRKNCRDAEGHVYGAQENYEAELARGAALWAWRAGLVLLVPLALVSTLATWAVVVIVLVVVLAALLLLGLAGLSFPRVRRWPVHQELFGDAGGRRFERALARPFSRLERVLWAPVVRPFFWLAAALAFGRARRQAMAFLVTRPVLTGTGTLHPDERFGLSEKGPAIVGLSRRSVAPEDRCVWDDGNLCKALLGLAMLRGRRFASLFARRQRFQLGLSDSNVTQVAEYLKLGTTTLVLDMIEAGVLADLPRLRRPLQALHQVIADPSLRAQVRWGDEALTALEVQRRYWERARDFVRRSPTPSLEAAELVELWGRTLDGLERDPASQVGRVDWVTKRFLLDTAGQGEPWAVRKTIDLKLHELGPGGYLAQLEAEGLAPRLVSPAEVEAAIYEPPPDSPAQRRSRLIRELGDQHAEIKVYWDRVRVGGPLRGRVIRLADYRPARERDDD
ncbi:MAG: proteasome accessory factor PafA2 family protein [Myxococcales bacterium]|nr:proteasome accessory factor PafA2 family protein [Myxococcales bacterium]